MFSTADLDLMIHNERRAASELEAKAKAAEKVGADCPNPVWGDSYFKLAEDYRAQANQHLTEAEYWLREKGEQGAPIAQATT